MTGSFDGHLFLHPGAVFFGTGRGRVRTVLGSCVAVVLWHPQRRLGGMCHFVLPQRHGAREGELDGRYGDEALELLRRAAVRHRTTLGEYDAYLFGGGNMFPHVAASGAPLIGEQNIAVADAEARRLGLRVVKRDVGTARYRNVILDLTDGAVSATRTQVQLLPP